MPRYMLDTNICIYVMKTYPPAVREKFNALADQLEAQRAAFIGKTADPRAEVQAMHFEMMAAWTRRDLSAYYAINARIHGAINSAARPSAIVGLGGIQMSAGAEDTERLMNPDRPATVPSVLSISS